MLFLTKLFLIFLMFVLPVMILTIIFFIFIIKQKNKKLFLEKINNFSSYISVLEYYMDKAYSIIYNQKIMIYSIEGSKLSDNELDSISRDFIKLTIKFIGPNISNELKEFYGDYETLYFIIGQTFYFKYEDDSIRNASVDDIIS
jgi:hypothetical protein